MNVDVTVNGTFVETWSFREGEPPPRRTLRIPAELIGSREVLTVGFGIREPRSPASVGLSRDPRQIGLGLVDVHVSSVE